MEDPETTQELSFAWDEDDSLAAGLSALGELLGNCEGSIGRMSALHAHGLDPELLAADLHVNAIDCTLLFTSLQALGILDPNLRTLIIPLMHRINDCAPEPSEELQEAMALAVESVMEDFAGQADEIGRQIFQNPNGDSV